MGGVRSGRGADSLDMTLAVLSVLDDAVILVDEDRGQARLNPAAAKMLKVADPASAPAFVQAMKALQARVLNPLEVMAVSEQLAADAQAGVLGSTWHFAQSPTHVLVTSFSVSQDGFTGRVWVLADVSAEHQMLQQSQIDRRFQADAYELFRSAMQNARVGSCIVGADGQFIEVNHALCHMLGRTREELLTLTWKQVSYPEDLLRGARELEQIYQGTRDGFDLRKRYQRPDGSLIWVDLSVSALRDAEGRIRYFVDHLVDVTAQMAAEMHLAESESRLRTTADAMLDPQVLIETVRDADGAIVDFAFQDVNRATTQYLGMEREQLLGRLLTTSLPALAQPQLLRLYADAVRTGHPVVINDVAYFNAVLALQRRYDIRAAQVGDGLTLTWRDVTDRYDAQQRLAQSEEHFRLLAENASDIVFCTDVEGRFTWVSPSITALLGWRPQDLVNQSFADFLHPDDDASTEARFRTADGGWRWLSVTSRTILDDDGVARSLVGSARDVQAEHETRKALTRESERLAATLESMLNPHVMLEAVHDATGAVVDFAFKDANGAAVQYLSSDRKDLLSGTVRGHLSAAGAALIVRWCQQVMDTADPLDLDDVRFPGAQTKWWEVKAVLVGNQVSFTWRDVTERHNLVERIAESEEHYRLLAQNSLDVVVLVRDGVMTWLSPALTAALGWLPRDWEGRAFADFTHPDDDDFELKHRRRVEAGRPLVSTLRMQDHDGEYHWVELHSSPYRDADGNRTGIVASFRVVDDEVAADQELDQLARFDELTGLLNRREALNYLKTVSAESRITGTTAGVLFCDVDWFKAVNDTHGHPVGDAVLRVIGARLQGAVRRQDVVARMGGDEFLVILPGVADLEQVSVIASQVHRHACAAILEDGLNIEVTLSIGATVAGRGEVGEELIVRADEAMYEAKRNGRNQVVTIP